MSAKQIAWFLLVLPMVLVAIAFVIHGAPRWICLWGAADSIALLFIFSAGHLSNREEGSDQR